MQLRTEVEIDAPPEVVWKVLSDLSTYHEWNPFITTFDGPLKEGAQVRIVVSPPDSSDFRFRPVILKVLPNRELRWRGTMIANFFFWGEHFIELTKTAQNKTRVVHGEDFGGFLLKFLLGQMGATQRGFVHMNQALKRRAEALYAATGSPLSAASLDS